MTKLLYMLIDFYDFRWLENSISGFGIFILLDNLFDLSYFSEYFKKEPHRDGQCFKLTF